MHADSTHCAKCARVWIVPDHGAAMDPQPESVLTMQSQQDASMLQHCNDRSNSEWFTKDNSFDKLCLRDGRSEVVQPGSDSAVQWAKWSGTLCP